MSWVEVGSCSDGQSISARRWSEQVNGFSVLRRRKVIMFRKLKFRIEALFDRWRVTKSESERHRKTAVHSGVSTFALAILGFFNFLFAGVSPLWGGVFSASASPIIALALLVVANMVIHGLSPRQSSAQEIRELKGRLANGVPTLPKDDKRATPSPPVCCPWCGYEVKDLPVLKSNPSISRCSECGDLVHRTDVCDVSLLDLELSIEILAIRDRAMSSQMLVFFGVMIAIVMAMLLLVLLPGTMLANFNLIALAYVTQPAALYLQSAYWSPRIREARQLLIFQKMGGEK